MQQASQALGERFGEAACDAWRGPERPPIESIRVRFGSVGIAKGQLGLTAYEPGPQVQYTDEPWQQALVALIRSQWSTESYIGWARHERVPSLTVIKDRVGGFTAGLDTVWNWMGFAPSEDGDLPES